MGLSTRASRLLYKCRENAIECLSSKTSSAVHGRPQKFFPGEATLTFADLSQVADDAMQMDVNKTL